MLQVRRIGDFEKIKYFEAPDGSEIIKVEVFLLLGTDLQGVLQHPSPNTHFPATSGC